MPYVCWYFFHSPLGFEIQIAPVYWIHLPYTVVYPYDIYNLFVNPPIGQIPISTIINGHVRTFYESFTF